MTYDCPCILNIKHNFEMESNADDIEKSKTFINTNVNRSKTITFMYTKPPKNINYLEQTWSNGILMEQSICGEEKLPELISQNWL